MVTADPYSARTPTDGFLHERLADHVRGLIQDGTLRGGDRVPSLRAMRRRFGVSMATATRAYEGLEATGWIEARPQSGFYVRRAGAGGLAAPRPGRPAGQPRRLDVASLLETLGPGPAVPDGEGVTLSLALPDPVYLPIRALQRSVSRVQREHPGTMTAYAFPPGLESLRRQIAYRVHAAGARVHPDEVLVTSGCAEALSIALQCVARPGDVVAVESPAFFNILTLIERLGMQALELATDPASGPDLDALERAFAQGRAQAALLVPSFGNPLGSCMDEAGRARLAALAARYRVPVIEDDIYGDLHFGPTRPPLVRAFDDDGWVLTASSFSKTIAPGYRVGWLLAGRWHDPAIRLKHAASMATATLPQAAIADFLDRGGYERHLRRVRRAYRGQLETMRHAIARHFPPGTRVTDPAGGFLLWVELPPGTRALDVYHGALDAGIRVAPGDLFSTGDTYSGYLRLSCGVPWDEHTQDAVRRLGAIAEAAGAGRAREEGV